MDDRQLLEYAAKAVSVTYFPSKTLKYGLRVVRLDAPQGKVFIWDPLGNSGEAFGLAVKLELNTYIIAGKAWACIAESTENECSVDLEDDPYAAQRRSIVLCAASIGKMMEEQENEQ